MKKVFIFDFDGTFYSGKHKFDKVQLDIEKNRRKFLPKLTDKQYKMICQDNPRWSNAITGNDIVRCMLKLMKKYTELDINPKDFYLWQNDFIYDIVLDYTQVVDAGFIEQLCKEYSVYVVSNSSLKHIHYYMNKLNIDSCWFNGVYANEFKKEDPTKQQYYKEIMVKENVNSYDIYVIGDSVESDLIPAIHLGMNAFYLDDAVYIKELVNKIINYNM